MSSVMCFGINKLLLNFATTSTAVFGAYFKLQTFVYMAILGKAIGINEIWWSFLISETVTVILAIIYLGIAEKKELINLCWNIQ